MRKIIFIVIALLLVCSTKPFAQFYNGYNRLELMNSGTSVAELRLRGTSGDWQLSGPRMYGAGSNEYEKIFSLWYYNASPAKWNHGLTITEDSKIGIGLTSSGNMGGNTKPNFRFSMGDELNDKKLAVWDGGVGQFIGLGVAPGLFRFTINNSGADRFGFYNGNATGQEVFTIQGSGNVGIGTVYPSRPLEISNTNNTAVVPELLLNNTAAAQQTYSNRIALKNTQPGNNFATWEITGPRQYSSYSELANNLLFEFSDNTGSYRSIFSMAYVAGKTFVGVATKYPKTELSVQGVASILNSVGSVGLSIGVNDVANNAHAYIQTEANRPLILNPTSTFGANPNKNYVAIGFTPSQLAAATTMQNYALAVKGNIVCQELRVKDFSVWPDYVFDPAYTNMPLDSVEQYILLNKHLPGVPSESEVKKDGIEVGAMNAVLLKKVEELTLHLIKMEKDIKKVNAENSRLQKLVEVK